MTEEAFNYNAAALIEGEPTNIVCHKFQNKVFLLITQYGKIANLYTVRNQSFNGGIGRKQKLFDIKPQMGAQNDEIEGAIRYLMNFIDGPDNLVISLALKRINKDVLVGLRGELGKISVLKG